MKILPLIILIALSITAKSQENESFYVFDANWKPTKIESAHFIQHTHMVNDTCWQYLQAGPIREHALRVVVAGSSVFVIFEYELY